VTSPNKTNVAKSLWQLIVRERNWFLLPVVMGLMLVMGLLALAKLAPMVSPFLYTLF